VLDDPAELLRLKSFCDDAGFVEDYKAQRRRNKQALASRIHELTAVRVDPTSLFDVQIKRIHEYKRQLLNILEAVAVYLAIRKEPERSWVPRVKLFAGKAAASYDRAKLIIKLAGDVGQVINSDPLVGDKLKVVFMPNYSVSLAQCIIPGSDLSEQISTAGMEASGTGNMKLALNGAITIGTLDGANIEIRERVGADHFFLFGLTAAQVAERRAQGLNTEQTIAATPALARVLDALASGAFSPDEPARYRELVDTLRFGDYFLVNPDFASYVDAQARVDERWRDRDAWWRSAIANTANVGFFSSDRTIREYAGEVWQLPVKR